MNMGNISNMVTMATIILLLDKAIPNLEDTLLKQNVFEDEEKI